MGKHGAGWQDSDAVLRLFGPGRAAGCPKINLQVRSSNTAVLEFYKRIGFKMDDVVSLGKRLGPDN